MLVYTVGWPDVMIALIAGLPSIIGAIYSVKIKREIKTPSGGTIGEGVERGSQSAHANHMMLKAINGGLVKERYIADGITPPDGTTPNGDDKVGANEHD